MWLLLTALWTATAAEPDTPDDPKPVVMFVHGMFMTPTSWRGWEDFFEARGYRTVSPSWPGRGPHPASLRLAPDPALRDLTLDDVVAVYRDAIAELDHKPVLIGHSMGGLVVELLLQEDLAVAGVAIDAAPPKGVNSMAPSFFRSNAPVLVPTRKPINPSKRAFRYAFAHTLPKDEVAEIYEHHVVPESRRVGRGPTTKAAKIDFTAEHPPLLLIAGEDDHIIPASLVRKVAKKYAKGPSRTDLLAFEDRVHWICGQEGWEEVAGAVMGWLVEVEALDGR